MPRCPTSKSFLFQRLLCVLVRRIPQELSRKRRRGRHTLRLCKSQNALSPPSCRAVSLTAYRILGGKLFSLKLCSLLDSNAAIRRFEDFLIPHFPINLLSSSEHLQICTFALNSNIPQPLALVSAHAHPLSGPLSVQGIMSSVLGKSVNRLTTSFPLPLLSFWQVLLLKGGPHGPVL